MDHNFIKVAVRARPLLDEEKSSKLPSCLQFTDNNHIIVAYERGFNFNYVFDEATTQEKIYEQCGADCVQNVLAGCNSTIFAYGQTGSGKTFTMGTGYQPALKTNWEHAGIIPRAITDIFTEIDRVESSFEVSISFFEIYVEDIYDLLSEKRTKIKLRDQGNSVILTNLTEFKVSCAEEAMGCLERGAAHRTTGATALNSCSSRSHTIFTIYLRETKNNGESKVSNLNLVDLAGSETVKKTKAEGERFREGVTINLSLMKLMHVITSLNSKNRSHIPYRDSVLTQVLKDSLNGNGKMLMIACISSYPLHLAETVTTLKYANEARHLKGKQSTSFKISAKENNPFRKELDRVPQTPANRRDRLNSMPTPSNQNTPLRIMNSTISDPSSATKDRLLMPPPLPFCAVSPLSTIHEQTNYPNDDDLQGLISPLAKKVQGMVQSSMNQTLLTFGNELLSKLKRRSMHPDVDTSPFPGINLSKGGKSFFSSPIQCERNLQSSVSAVNATFDDSKGNFDNSEREMRSDQTIIQLTDLEELSQTVITSPHTDSLDELTKGKRKSITNQKPYELQPKKKKMKESKTQDCCPENSPFRKELDGVPQTPTNRRDRLNSMPTPSNQNTPLRIMNSTISDPSSAAKDRLLMPPPLPFCAVSPLSTCHEQTNDDDLTGLISPLTKKVQGMVQSSMNQTLLTFGNELLSKLKRRTMHPAADISPFPGINLSKGRKSFSSSPLQCRTNLQSSLSAVNATFDDSKRNFENSESEICSDQTILRLTDGVNPISLHTDSLDELTKGKRKQKTNQKTYDIRPKKKENNTPDCCRDNLATKGNSRGKKLRKNPVNTALMEKHSKCVLNLINVGNAKQLQSLPVIGPKSAQIIFTWRRIYGPFENMNALKKVKGLQKNFFPRFLEANILT